MKSKISISASSPCITGCAYRTIDVEDLTKHKMESEQTHHAGVVSGEPAKEGQHNICAVVLRCAWNGGKHGRANCRGRDGPTSSFSRRMDTLPTADSNFNRLTHAADDGCAWCYERIMDLYQLAIKEKYRFGAYGDAMLIID